MCAHFSRIRMHTHTHIDAPALFVDGSFVGEVQTTFMISSEVVVIPIAIETYASPSTAHILLWLFPPTIFV